MIYHSGYINLIFPLRKKIDRQKYIIEENISLKVDAMVVDTPGISRQVTNPSDGDGSRGPPQLSTTAIMIIDIIPACLLLSRQRLPGACLRASEVSRL